MAWPHSQDYNEAIQSPATCFSDAELKQGQAVANALGIPTPCSGNFADVYAFNCPATSNKWAIKCFTREIAGLKERYREISAYLKQTPLPFMVDFSYLEQGIRVRGQWYPILKMRWVEGFTLNEFVGNSLDKPQVLDVLSQIWVKLAAKLHEAQIAHCDLQHGNVLLVPGSKAASLAVKLVDYDGMCVPALTLLKSSELGQPNFQHPQRARDGIYSLDVDRFSHLVIYTALRALMVGGKPLWEKYDNSDNLLFKQSDFEDPGKSPLFQELLKSSDATVKIMAQTLADAAKKPLAESPLLHEIAAKLPGAKPAGTKVAPAAAAPAAKAVPAVEDMFAAATASTAAPRKKSAPPPKSNVPLIAAAVVGALVLVGGVAAFLAMRGGDKDKEKVVAKNDGDDSKKKLPDKEKKTGNPLLVNVPKKDPEPKDTKKTPEPQDIKPAPRPIPEAGKTAMTNSIGMKLAPIPAGEFLMGSPENEGNRQAVEGPQHKVKITRPFYMGVYEVKQGEYEKVMGKNPSAFKDSPDNPVEQVIWDEAVEFCKKLSELPDEKKAGRVYRLPTEAEWEYACRAGTTTVFHYGNSLSSKQANFNGEEPYGGAEKGQKIGKTVKCGSYQPNAWGLYDMHGNIWEWCLDRTRTYTPNPVDDPRGPETAGGFRMMRGGCWLHVASMCRSALRYPFSPSGRFHNIGFRVVCETASPPTEPDSPIIVFKSVTNLNDIAEMKNPGDWSIKDGKLTLEGKAPTNLWFMPRLEAPFWVKMTVVVGAGGVALTFGPEAVYEPVPVAGKYCMIHVPPEGPLTLEQAYIRIVATAKEKLAPGKRVLEARFTLDRLVVLVDDVEQLSQPLAGLPQPRRVGLFTGRGKFDVPSISWSSVKDMTPDPKPKADRVGEVFRLDGHTGEIGGLAFTRDGKQAISGGVDKTVRLWDLETGKQVRIFDGHTGPVRYLCLTPDGKQLITLCEDKVVRIFDVDSGNLERKLEGFPLDIKAQALVWPDGKRISLYCVDKTTKTVRLADFATGKEIRNFSIIKSNYNYILAFHPNGRQALVGGFENPVRLWDVFSGKELGTIDGKTHVYGGAFSADGKLFLTGGGDNLVRLWNVATGKELRVFRGHTAHVYQVAFSSDGRRILSGGADPVVRLWDVASGQELESFKGHTDIITRLAISPDGAFALSASRDQSVRYWRLPKPGEAQAVDSKLAILYAAYGADDGWADVTERLRKLIKDDRLKMPTGELDVADPAPFKRKTLLILYSLDGGNSVLHLSGQEQAVDLPAEPKLPSKELEQAPAAAPLAILYAVYGGHATWVDVTDKVRKFIRKNQLSLTSSDLKVADPAFGIHKSLIIVYSIQGKVFVRMQGDSTKTPLLIRVPLK